MYTVVLPPCATFTSRVDKNILTFFVFRRSPAVDPEILRTIKTVGFIGYAANPRTRPRNQVCHLTIVEVAGIN